MPRTRFFLVFSVTDRRRRTGDARNFRPGRRSRIPDGILV